jgi:signal transduction histidine kinase
VIVTDAELIVLHMNVAAEKLLNVKLGEVMGLPISRLNVDANFNNKVAEKLDIKGPMKAFDVDLPTGEGDSVCTYQVRVSRFSQEKLGSPGIVLLLRDVTREREIERMKSSFLGMAAHELNTPLTTIIGYTEILASSETLNKFSAEQQKEYLDLVHEKALALGTLIDDLLDISRVESGRPLSINSQDFDLKDMVENLVEGFSRQSPEHQFDLRLPDAPLNVCADRGRLVQVVEHLLSNAVKYSPGGGMITVDLQQDGAQTSLTVVDDGIGMNGEQLAHIYDRFYRADSTDTAVQGVGLGMSIVRHIILAHHGKIQVESELGNGTRVLVSIPCVPPKGHSEVFKPFNSTPD